MAAVVVSALGAGTGVLVRARPATTPVPAASSVPTTRSPVEPGPATLHAGGFGGDDPTYLVRLRPGTNGSSTVDVTDVTDASHGSRGPVVSLAPVPSQAGRRITWARVGATSTVVGVIPSGTAQSDVETRTDRNYGAWSVDVQPIPGSDWSAFVLTFRQPLRGRSQSPTSSGGTTRADPSARAVAWAPMPAPTAAPCGSRPTAWRSAPSTGADDGARHASLPADRRGRGNLDHLASDDLRPSAGGCCHRGPVRRPEAASAPRRCGRQIQRGSGVVRDRGDELSHPDRLLLDGRAGQQPRGEAVTRRHLGAELGRSRRERATFRHTRSVGRV